jgi:hypothetical protein
MKESQNHDEQRVTLLERKIQDVSDDIVRNHEKLACRTMPMESIVGDLGSPFENAQFAFNWNGHCQQQGLV